MRKPINPPIALARQEARLLIAKEARNKLQRLTRKLLEKYPEEADLIMTVLDGCWHIAHDFREARKRERRQHESTK